MYIGYTNKVKIPDTKTTPSNYEKKYSYVNQRSYFCILAMNYLLLVFNFALTFCRVRTNLKVTITSSIPNLN